MANHPKITPVAEALASIFEETSGIDVREFPENSSFFDMGMDSLILTQVSVSIERKFKLKISFRALLDDLGDVASLANHISAHSPEVSRDANESPSTINKSPLSLASVPKTEPTEAQMTPSHLAPPTQKPQIRQVEAADLATELDGIPFEADPSVSSIVHLFHAQIALLEKLGRKSGLSITSQQDGPAARDERTAAVAQNAPTTASTSPSESDKTLLSKPFGAIARISKDHSAMTPAQASYFQDLIRRYTTKTNGSRQHTQRYRATHADPRVVTGFKPHLKEIIYPIVIKKSKGAHLWDIDDHRYVDLTCGFGSNFFGNMPDWLQEKLVRQIQTGVEIGPQHELAGIVSQKMTDYIGHDRVAFSNTGSEAILGAVRIARTVTGRDRIVTFAGSYHGIIDEVIVRANKAGKSFPAAPGIMSSAVGNVTVLDYGVESALDIISSQGDQIAAVLVECVQSRRPDFRPREFLQELRKICDAKGIVLIADEIITGFRTGRFGAQGYFGIKADIATYGKVIGGGISIGVIAGKRQYMDALDGGHWQFGDQSVPEVGVTYFAGTFVRHPLALAAMDAVLDFLNSQSDAPAMNLAKKADNYAQQINAICERRNAPWHYVNFGSMMKLNASEEFKNLELLVYLLRLKGVHTWDGFPNFLTLAHSDQDIHHVVQAFEESVQELGEAGFFPMKATASPADFTAKSEGFKTPQKPEIPANQGTKIGRDDRGDPVEFQADPLNPGRYIVVKKGASA